MDGEQSPMPGTTDEASKASPTVFLSYARADQDAARKLAHALGESGLVVWWDTLIEGGAAFARTIEAALDRCDAVLVLWSPRSVESDWVLDEAARGRELHKLVPVTLDGTMPPLGFRQYQSIDLSRWSGQIDAGEIAAIARGVAAVRGRADAAPALPPARRGSPGRTLNRRALLIGGVGGLAVVGTAAWYRGLLDPRPPPSGNSIAVLPFKNLSGDPAQEYFSDGLSEELRATLARNLKLQVMAQASSAKFRARVDDAVTIASELTVAYLLDGSVRRSGDIVRITADLVDGKTGFSRWTQTFDRSMRDIFAVQSEIASTVAGALAARIAPAAAPGIGSADALAAAGGTRSIEAYDAYLRGRALYDLSADETSERAALAQFDAAIAADRNFAPAHAARARSLTAIANQYGKVGQLEQAHAAAIASAQRAIEIAPDLADAYSTLGFALFQGRLDARAAREPFEKSRVLGAGEATVLARYAQFCARTGRDPEAVESMRRALVLDKLNPLIYRAAGSVEYAARRFAASIPPLREGLAMNPRMSRAHAAIGDALFMLGRHGEALAAFRAEPSGDFAQTGIAIVERRRGGRQAAQAAFDAVVAEGDRLLYQQAQVLAQWGEPDAALRRLRRAREIGDSGLIYARNDPLLDPVRRRPEFNDLLLSLGFA
jgi:TolB-like protein